MKYKVTGWMQITVSIDEYVEADNEDEAKDKIYYNNNSEYDINDLYLEADLIVREAEE